MSFGRVILYLSLLSQLLGLSPILATDALALTLAFGSLLLPINGAPDTADASKAPVCSQADPLYPTSVLRDHLETLYKSDVFVDQAAELLGGAVRIPYVLRVRCA